MLKGVVRRVAALFGAWAPTQSPEDQINSAVLLRALLSQYERRLRQDSNVSGATVAERLNRRRYASRKVSELKRKIRRGKQVRLSRKALVAKFSPSPILDSVFPERENEWVPHLSRRRNLPQSVTITQFSFIDHPQRTLAYLRSFAQVESKAPYAHLHFDDEFCIDISAYLVLAEAWPHTSSVFQGGRMAYSIQKVLCAVGLDRHMKMDLIARGDTSEIWAFPVEKRHMPAVPTDENRDLAPQPKERVADRFCDAVDTWLNELEMCLSDTGKEWFASIIGEVLDNAERHSGDDLEARNGNWSCAAFMARREEGGQQVFRCYMGFLSVGRTIAESLGTAPAATLEDIQEYARKHENSAQSAATLTTLYAVQDTITRVHDAHAEGRGGIGFQEIIRFINELSGPSRPGLEPKLTIVSGGSCIKLRPPYFKPIRMAMDRPRMIWCNATNSPHTAPDPDYVFDLDEFFEGTVVGISFVLDPEYLQAVANGRDQSGEADGERRG